MSAPIVLIVGAGDYIGAAIARRFARGGFTVCMGRRRGELLDPLVAEIEAEGGRATGYAMDARDEDSVAEIFRRVEAEVGPIDIVIFNVGGNVKFDILETTARVFRKVWEMCSFAAFLNGREAARYMAERGRGSIFFTGASASLRGRSGFAAFSAGKAAMRAMAQSMAKELGPQNIHVAHLVIDSPVDTASVRERIAAAGIDVDAMEPDRLMQPASVAEIYWQLHHQSRDAWTFEVDLRPYCEAW